MTPAEAERPLRTLTVSPRVVGGGAEKVALTLHEAYLERDVDSWLAVGFDNGHVPQSLEIPNDAHRSPWARGLLGPADSLEARSSRRGDPYGLLSRALRIAAEPLRYARVARGHEDFAFPESASLLALPPRTPDVVHFHNLHGSYFDVRALPGISAAKPTMLTLHDAWLLTGHCAHPLDCPRWMTGCGECPDLDRYVPIRRDASAQNWRIKRDAVRASRLAIAAPSQWLLRMVESSQLIHEGLDARCVPNGVDTRVFRPANKTAARRSLDLPEDAYVAVFAAQGLRSSQLKGFGTLLAALSQLGQRDLGRHTVFLALGEDAPTQTLGSVTLMSSPFLRDPADVARYYQAADLYVHPTRAESFGLTVAEAMACGTAVVASDVGGIPELMADGLTGLLVEPDDPSALAAAIETLLLDPRRLASMGAAAVDRVAANFTLDRQVNTYLAWYAEMIDARAREGAAQ